MNRHDLAGYIWSPRTARRDFRRFCLVSRFFFSTFWQKTHKNTLFGNNQSANMNSEQSAQKRFCALRKSEIKLSPLKADMIFQEHRHSTFGRSARNPPNNFWEIRFKQNFRVHYGIFREFWESPYPLIFCDIPAKLHHFLCECVCVCCVCVC